MKWTNALWVSAAALHGPYLLMALYTFLFVPCTHCKYTAAMLAPVGPGLLGGMFAARLVGLHISDTLALLIAAGITLVNLIVLAAIVRVGTHWLIIGGTLAVLGGSFLAYGTLAAIRS